MYRCALSYIGPIIYILSLIFILIVHFKLLYVHGVYESEMTMGQRVTGQVGQQI